jgi:hypothetical protein
MLYKRLLHEGRIRRHRTNWKGERDNEEERFR